MEKKVLQVNGKAYDAVTGRRIDGFIAPKKALAVTKTAKKAAQQAPSTVRATNHATPHRPLHAQTLKRQGVNQPAKGLKKQLHPQHEIAHSTHVIPVKHGVNHVDTARLQRATGASQHEQVRRFSAPHNVPVTFAEIPVQHAPQDLPTNEPPVVPPPIQSNEPVDMFEHAIANATHFVDIAGRKTQFKKKARRHALAMSSGVLALLFIGGFLAYQNTPKLQVKVAGAVAGVSTRMPDLKAAGFTYEGVSANGSRVTYTFKSSLASYRLVAQATSWSGEDMIKQVSSVSASGMPNYQTVSSGTLTIYKFSDRHATWVNHGTWYQVHGDQPLSDAQLKSLAIHS